jgi:hypothetical protein
MMLVEIIAEIAIGFLIWVWWVIKFPGFVGHGFCAGLRGMIPCARRQRSERRRAFSRRSSGVCFGMMILG